MRTQHLFDKYNKEISDYQNRINTVKKQIEDNNQQLSDLNSKYKNTLKNNNFQEAESIYSDVSELEEKNKALVKEHNIKTSMFNDVKNEKMIDLLSNLSVVDLYYKDDFKKVLNKLDKIIRDYNNVIDELKKLNSEYSQEKYKYYSLIETKGLIRNAALKEKMNGMPLTKPVNLNYFNVKNISIKDDKLEVKQ
ncbi:hypothetical protein BU020_11450 [Staphylococcus simulans]|uniref:coiled-coil domain-containing protein n=2 Tax=Staphylococcus simulans TaxID=1286 RepID=UPI000D1E6AD9|nr:hypothetical protein [Staphylococcus simulans]PTJ91804.1 hypothetical protein BU020_11450 [Staphylococcus simulans]